MRIPVFSDITDREFNAIKRSNFKNNQSRETTSAKRYFNGYEKKIKLLTLQHHQKKLKNDSTRYC